MNNYILKAIQNARKNRKKIFLVDEQIVSKLEDMSAKLDMTPEELVWISLWLLEKSAGRKVEITELDSSKQELITRAIDFFKDMEKVSNL
jgi:hypothetical protein